MKDRQTGRKWEPWRTEKVVVREQEQLLCHNNRYHVFIHRYPGTPHNIIHLSIRNNDRSPRRDWRDFQRIKNELVGAEYEMVEMYPREDHKVDLSNQYHLWGFETTEPILTQAGFGWSSGKLVWNGISPKPDIPETKNSVQRPSAEESTV